MEEGDEAVRNYYYCCDVVVYVIGRVQGSHARCCLDCGRFILLLMSITWTSACRAPPLSYSVWCGLKMGEARPPESLTAVIAGLCNDSVSGKECLRYLPLADEGILK